MAAATLKQRQVVARILADGGSYAEAAHAAGVSRRTAIRWAQEAEDGSNALPDPATISTPRAVLEALLHDPQARIRLDAAKALATLDLEGGGSPDVPEFDRMEVVEDLESGAEPYSVLVVHRPPAQA